MDREKRRREYGREKEVAEKCATGWRVVVSESLQGGEELGQDRGKKKEDQTT